MNRRTNEVYEKNMEKVNKIKEEIKMSGELCKQRNIEFIGNNFSKMLIKRIFVKKEI